MSTQMGEEGRLAKQSSAAPDPTQMTVAKADRDAPAELAQVGNPGALKSSGMNRDRTDKNAIADEFDFAAMRAGLGKKKDDGDSAVPKADEPATPLTKQPSQLQRQGSQVSRRQSVGQQPSVLSPKSMVQPPSQAPPSQAPDAPAPGTPGQPPLSRQGSRMSAAAAAAAGGAEPVGEPAPISLSREPSGVQRQASAAQLSRRGSRQSAGAVPLSASRQGTIQPGATLTAEEAAGLVPQLSRQGSAAVISRKGSAIAPQLSRHGTAVSVRSEAIVAARQPTVTIAAEDDDMAGVDWRMTSKHHQQRADQLEARLKDREADLAAAERRAKEATERADDLERMLQASRRGSGSVASASELAALRAENQRLKAAGGGGGDAELHAEIQRLQEQLAGAQGQVVEREVIREVVRHEIPPEVDQLMQEAHQKVEVLTQQVNERDAHIQDLNGQLDSAHEAIIAATHTGFEHDIKLHQARAALSALLKRERSSPKRGRLEAEASSPQQACFDNYPSAAMASGRAWSASPPQAAYVTSPVLQQRQVLQGQIVSYPSGQAFQSSPPSGGVFSPTAQSQMNYQGRFQTPGGSLQTPTHGLALS